MKTLKLALSAYAPIIARYMVIGIAALLGCTVFLPITLIALAAVASVYATKRVLHKLFPGRIEYPALPLPRLK